MNEMQKTEYLLAPGYIILPEVPMLIYMILGSCVTVILYNKCVKKAGCCHFIIPRTPDRSHPMPKHGTAAVITLIRMLLEKGGSIDDLEAQIIGGGDLPGRSLGKENAVIAENILKKKGVHITSKDVGGEKGRKVVYNTDTNHVAVIKVERIRSSDWYPNEDNTE